MPRKWEKFYSLFYFFPLFFIFFVDFSLLPIVFFSVLNEYFKCPLSIWRQNNDGLKSDVTWDILFSFLPISEKLSSPCFSFCVCLFFFFYWQRLLCSSGQFYWQFTSSPLEVRKRKYMHGHLRELSCHSRIRNERKKTFLSLSLLHGIADTRRHCHISPREKIGMLGMRKMANGGWKI